MNKDTLISVIGNNFKDLSEIKDQRIFRAEYRPNGKPAGVFYFDFDENDIPNDLKEYQDNLLVNDYYNHPGYLQWNYYLIFLRNSFDESTKKKVETNDIYTRKYLLQPEELTRFLSYSKSEKIIHEDVVVEWRKKLDEVELNEIYSYVPVTEVRDRFLDFSVLKEYDRNNYKEEEL